MEEVDWKQAWLNRHRRALRYNIARRMRQNSVTRMDLVAEFMLNQSSRNNAFARIGRAAGEIIDQFPMLVSVRNSDNGSKFIN
jgi:hypothetical protein